jgi:hypothetical protein
MLNSGSRGYNELMSRCVPQEFRNIALIYDEILLDSWYKKTEDHRPEFQMFQALQLFARTYHFDHYWQLEMDARFLVNAREYFDSLAEFADHQPQKQSLRRASYRYMSSRYPTYDDFAKAVDAGSLLSTNGFTRPNVAEIPEPYRVAHPQPPTSPPNSAAEHTAASQPVEPTDLILTNTVVPVLEMTEWPYLDYAHGFTLEAEFLPRLQSPVSMVRCSALLLNLIHDAQAAKGLALPSEATAASFAWFHDLKIVHPPIPFFMRDSDPDLEEIERLFNGGPVEEGKKGPALYDPIRHWDLANNGTWHWGGTWPREIMDVFLGIKQIDRDDDLPWILRRDEAGKIWAPGLLLHPVKTNV